MLFYPELTKRKAIRCKHNLDLSYLAYPAYCCTMRVVVAEAGLLHLIVLVSVISLFLARVSLFLLFCFSLLLFCL